MKSAVLLTKGQMHRKGLIKDSRCQQLTLWECILFASNMCNCDCYMTESEEIAPIFINEDNIPSGKLVLSCKRC